MRSGRWYAAIALAGIAVAFLLPLSPALSPGDVRQARFVGAVCTATVCAAFGLSRGGQSLPWLTVALVSTVAGLMLFAAHVNANARCVATYDGRPIVIGRDFASSAASYVSQNPGLSAADLLLDAGGVAERIWTPASISSCRLWITWGGLLAMPLFAIAVCALVARRGFRFLPAATRPAAVAHTSQPALAPVFDAFLSYRHTEPDKTRAKEVLAALESRGLRVAVDFRDFAPNQHFLAEMERCIKESRFVLCVVTSQYLDSDNCFEEAIISKTLDMADRRKRLVPLIFEQVDLPVWLHGLVGVDFTESASVDPFDRLLSLLIAPPVAARK
jgi:TIR domain